MTVWKSKMVCSFCGSRNVFPILLPKTKHFDSDRIWECQNCDSRWEADSDNPPDASGDEETLWDGERYRYLKRGNGDV